MQAPAEYKNDLEMSGCSGNHTNDMLHVRCVYWHVEHAHASYSSLLHGVYKEMAPQAAASNTDRIHTNECFYIFANANKIR